MKTEQEETEAAFDNDKGDNSIRLEELCDKLALIMRNPSEREIDYYMEELKKLQRKTKNGL